MSTTTQRRAVSLEDTEAALAARRDLGAGYDGEIAETLADRIEEIVDARVQARLAEQAQQARQHQTRSRLSTWTSTLLLSCAALIGVGTLLHWLLSTDPVSPYLQALCVAGISAAAGYTVRRRSQRLSGRKQGGADPVSGISAVRKRIPD